MHHLHSNGNLTETLCGLALTKHSVARIHTPLHPPGFAINAWTASIGHKEWEESACPSCLASHKLTLSRRPK